MGIILVRSIILQTKGNLPRREMDRNEVSRPISRRRRPPSGLPLIGATPARRIGRYSATEKLSRRFGSAFRERCRVACEGDDIAARNGEKCWGRARRRPSYSFCRFLLVAALVYIVTIRARYTIMHLLFRNRYICCDVTIYVTALVVDPLNRSRNPNPTRLYWSSVIQIRIL